MLSLDDLHQPPYGSVEEAIEKSVKEFAYVAGDDGLYKIFRAGGPDAPVEFTVVTGVHEAPSLKKIKEGFFVRRMEKIHPLILARASAIFRREYDKSKSEMIVILKWDEMKKEYYLDRVKFGVVGPGYLRYCYDGERCGTIHSHGGIRACFSSTDDGDDKDRPGIHLVMGSFGDTDPTIVSSITGAGERLNLRHKEPEDWIWKYEITDEEFAWFSENILLIKDVQSKSDGFYIVEKESRKVAFWTPTKEEAETLIDPFFEIEAVKKKDQRRFYLEDDREDQEERKGRMQRLREGSRKKKRDPLMVSSQEAAISGLVNFVLDNDLLYEFADIFALQAPEEKVDELMEHLEGCVSFAFETETRRENIQIEDDSFDVRDFDASPLYRSGLCNTCYRVSTCRKQRGDVSVCGEYFKICSREEFDWEEDCDCTED